MAITPEQQAQELIIKNINLLEDVIPTMVNLQDKILTEMMQVIDTWSQDNGFYFCDESDRKTKPLSLNSWFCHEEYLTDKETGCCYAYFDLTFESYITRVTSAEYFLTHLLGFNNQQIGFAFYIYQPAFDNVDKKVLKQLTSNLDINHPEISHKGFKFFSKYENGSWFIPFKFSQDNLITAIKSGDFDEVMQPLRDVLETIKEIHEKYFMKLVENAKKEFGTKKSE